MTERPDGTDGLLVLHVITSLAVGGAEQLLLNLIRGSRETMLRHVVCQLGPPDDLAGAIREMGCEVFRLSDRRKRRYLRAYRRLGTLIAEVRPDLVHSWLFHARFAASLASGGTHWRPHIASIVGTDYEPDSIVQTGLSPTKMALQRLVERRIASRVDTYVANSQAVKESYVRRVGISAERISVIPNSVDPERVRFDSSGRRTFRQLLGMPESAFLFVNLSRLIPGKGHHDLLVAFDRLASTDPDIWLALAGQGPLEPSLSEQVGQIRSGERIRMLGTVADVTGLLSAADAFVFPSYSEGFSVSLAEAMVVGLPIAASDIPANREMAGNPPTMLLGRSGDVTALQNLMLRLRVDTDMASSLGLAARQRALAAYTINRTTPQWMAAYEAARVTCDGA